MNQNVDEGKIYTMGKSFRALAEAQQRRYRAEVLRQPCGAWGHWLALADPPEETRGNFLCDAGYEAARKRAANGKGVDVKRTFGNMLSSQAMCFNVFGPLTSEPNWPLAARVLRNFVSGMALVKGIELEYTPVPDVFGDQTGSSGVDCDILIDFTDDLGLTGV